MSPRTPSSASASQRSRAAAPQARQRPASKSTLYDYGVRRSGQTHGVVLTKPHVVSLILELSGYTQARDLTRQRLLDPACGHGAFVLGAVERLLVAARRVGAQAKALREAIRAYDVDPEHVARTREAVVRLLTSHAFTRARAVELSETWIRQADFLLLGDAAERFDYVVGNPPYIRIEQLAASLQAQYRQRYRTLYDRADLYVAFIERGLSLLNASGVLSFICADRWTLNKYGAPLRALITASYQVRCYVALHDTSPFESEVIAYPSIFVFGSGEPAPTHVATLASASEAECQQLLDSLHTPDEAQRSTRYERWFSGNQPWVLSSPAQLDALRALERDFAPLAESARVGIGVATGNDELYIVDARADIEPSRLVPLVMRSDLCDGGLDKAARFVINTFESRGGLVELARYPRLRAYLQAHAAVIKQRHVARKTPSGWYRTIDRVYPELVRTPKLLFPDIAGASAPVYDEGRFHPHHNLYYVTSDRWDIEVLGGLLSSKVALFFVWSYAVKMRGGYLRFQAQYLRRICLPSPEALPQSLADALRAAFRERNFAALDELALRAYGLTALPDFDFLDTRR